jgi:hypothetical protein
MLEQLNMGNSTASLDGIERMRALAERFQAEGQVNLSKLLEAAVFARLHRAAWESRPLVTPATMKADFDAVLEILRKDDQNPHLLAALEAGQRLLAQDEVPLIEDAPDAFVCRSCGYTTLGAAPDRCPTCSAWAGGFRKFVGIFNSDNAAPTNPSDVLALLSSNASALKILVDGLTQDEMNRRPAPDVWAIHHHVAHFHGANETLDTRVNLMLTQDNPELAILALYDMASNVPPSSTSALLAEFLEKRSKLIARLETMPLNDFWSTGWHQEFGQITVLYQLMYMANHEQTHLPEIEALRSQILATR